MAGMRPPILESLRSAPRRLLSWTSRAVANIPTAIHSLRGQPASFWIVRGGIALAVISVTMLVLLLAVYQLAGQYDDKLQAALNMLDRGEYAAARRTAKRLANDSNLSLDDSGGPLFVLGAAISYEAESVLDADDQRRFYATAARYLQEARLRGLPPDRAAEGLFLLGNALHEIDQFTQAIPYLVDAAKLGFPQQHQIDRLLGSSYSRDSQPNFDLALVHADRYLASPQIAPEDRVRGLLLKTEILLGQGEADAAAKTLSEIPASARQRSEVVIASGRVLLAKAEELRRQDEADGRVDNADRIAMLHQQAIKELKTVAEGDSLAHAASSRSSYFIGRVLRHSGKLTAAREQFGRTHKLYWDYPEALPAALEEGEVLVELGQPDEALSAFRHCLQKAKEIQPWNNYWLSENEFRARMRSAYQGLIDARRFDLAVRLAQASQVALANDEALRLMADSYRHWGEHLLHQAERAGPSEQQEAAARGRLEFRRAGRAYAYLAKLHVTMRQYPDDLWASADAFANGQDYQSAIRVYQEYLNSEARTQRPLALVGLGKAYLALGQVDEALRVLQDCIGYFPNDPASYQARLVAADAYAELNELAQAKELLIDNLHLESLTPRSDAWRDSLFQLGELLYREARHAELAADSSGNALAATPGQAEELSDDPLEKRSLLFEDAIQRLSEAVQRYPEDSQAVYAHYLIAESHRRAARLPQQRLKTESIETRRGQLRRKLRFHLESAHDIYSQLIRALNQRPEGEPLSPLEKAVLRNSYFARGSVLYDLDSFEEAIAAYSSATSRYQHDPAAVEAYVQIASCYRRLNKIVESKGTLQQAKIVLQRIDEEADFTQTTRFDRQQWTDLLNWLSTL